MSQSHTSGIADLEQGHDISSLSTFIKVVLVIMLRSGFALGHWCTSAAEPGEQLLSHHAADLAVATAAYWLSGLPLTTSVSSLHPRLWDVPVHGWCCVLVATAMLSVAAAGRLRLSTHLVITAGYAGLVQPLLSRWVVSAHSRSAIVVVHLSGGALVLATKLVLGRRLVCVWEMDPRWSSPQTNSSHAVAACWLVAMGLEVLCLPVRPPPTQHSAPSGARKPQDMYPVLAAGPALAASAAVLCEMLVVLALRRPLDYWALLGTAQAAIAGIVTSAIAAQRHIPAVWAAQGLIGGLVFAILSRLMLLTWLEDSMNLLTNFLVCGLIAALLNPLFINITNMHFSVKMVLFGWHLFYMVTWLTVVLAYAYGAMKLFDSVNLLRTSREEEQNRRAQLAGRAHGLRFLRRFYPPAGHAASPEEEDT